MICPRCSGTMVEKRKAFVQPSANGQVMAKETAKVWFCRDCLCSIRTKK